MRLPIRQINVGERHRKDMGDLNVLAASIVEIGLLQPIGVTHDHTLIFGERRLRAFRDILGRDDIEVRVIDMPSIVTGESAENEVRKDFTPSERVAIAEAIEAEIGNRQGMRTDKLVQELAQVDAADPTQAAKGEKTRDFAAKKAGFGNPETYRQAKVVVTTAEPELVEAMDSGKVTIFAAHKAAKLAPEFQREVAKTGRNAEQTEREWAAETRKRTASEPLEIKFQTIADACEAISNTGVSYEQFLNEAAGMTVRRCQRGALATFVFSRGMVEASNNDQTRTG